MRLYKVFFLLIFAPNLLFSQILDDSTKAIYGPKSTSYFLEEDVINNISIKYQIDTLLENFHKNYTIQRKNNYSLQDLGNNGTSAKAIFLESKNVLGYQFGITSFDFNKNNIRINKYYDTKSPFSDLHYFQGGRGQDFARFVHSQNITKKFNIGIDLQNFASSKILGSPRGRDDRILKNWNISTHSNFTSKNNKYLLLAAYQYFSHFQTEQGGILPTSGDAIDKTFSYKLERVNMTRSSNTYKNHALHTYQQYKVSSGLQFYHVFDFQLNGLKFIDLEAQTSKVNGFYKQISPKSLPNSIIDSIGFYNFDNKFGFKGKLKGYNYRIHLKHRFINGFKADSSILSRNEVYGGFWTAYYFKDSTNKLIAEGEIRANADFYLKGLLSTKYGFAEITNTFKSPNFIQNYYNLIYLNEIKSSNFKQSNFVEVKVYPALTLKSKLQLKPFLQISNLSNHIYYDTLMKPTQFEKQIQLIRIGMNSSTKIKKWFFENSFSFNSSSQDVVRIPLLFFDLSVSYNFKFAEKLDIQMGLHSNFQTKFYADAYDPQSTQFHLQNKMKTQGYPNVDYFVNMKLSRVRLFFQATNFTNVPVNFTQWLTNGYFTTPSYTALPLAVGFGVNWPMFD